MAAKQTRRPKKQSACTYRHHVPGVTRLVLQEFEERTVFHHRVDAHTSRHAQHVELRRILERRIWREPDV
jgi:hypothetical protein